GGNAWESNPPRHAERGVTDVEDRETHRGPSAPARMVAANGRPGQFRAYHPVVTTLDEIPTLRLTSLTDCGGCAAKLGADLLGDALRDLGAEPAPADLIAGLDPPDDAA